MPVVTFLPAAEQPVSSSTTRANDDLRGWGADWKKTLHDPMDGSISDASDWPSVVALAGIAREHYSDGWAYRQREMAQILPLLNIAGDLEYGRTEIGIEDAVTFSAVVLSSTFATTAGI